MSLQVVIGVKRHNKPDVITWSDSSGELSAEFDMFGEGKYDEIYLLDAALMTVRVRMKTKAVWGDDATEQK